MKSFISAGIIFLCIIVASNFYTHSLENSIKELEKQLNAVEEKVSANQWEKAESELETLIKQWYDVEAWLKAIITHYEINMIEQVLCEIEGYTEQENAEEVLVKTKVLRMLLQHIPENEKPTLTNIL